MHLILYNVNYIRLDISLSVIRVNGYNHEHNDNEQIQHAIIIEAHADV